MPRTTRAETPTRDRRTGRRWLVLAGALAVACTALWAVATALGLGGVEHSENQVEDVSADVVETDGIRPALRDLHGHMNWAIWARGDVDQRAWLDTLEATVAALEDEGLHDTAHELALAGELLRADARLHQVHDQVEAVEHRYANAQAR